MWSSSSAQSFPHARFMTLAPRNFTLSSGSIAELLYIQCTLLYRRASLHFVHSIYIYVQTSIALRCRKCVMYVCLCVREEESFLFYPVERALEVPRSGSCEDSKAQFSSICVLISRELKPEREREGGEKNHRRSISFWYCQAPKASWAKIDDRFLAYTANGHARSTALNPFPPFFFIYTTRLKFWLNVFCSLSYLRDHTARAKTPFCCSRFNMVCKRIIFELIISNLVF